MDVFGKDALIGDYRLSDHGLTLCTFNYEDNYDLGVTHNTEEAFLGRNPVPVYLGSKYSSKLMPTFTVMQKECVTGRRNFTVNEIREILGRLTGYQGYKKFYLYKDEVLENMYYNVHVIDASFEKAGEDIVAITFSAECDSQFAWVDESITYENGSIEETIRLQVNSDDKYNYLLPTVVITPDCGINSFSIINVTDNNREVVIDNVSSGEVITMDSKHNIITSTIPRNFSEDFNYKFIRLLSGENELQISGPCSITFNMSLPRKVGVL
jgi:phage-related protein